MEPAKPVRYVLAEMPEKILCPVCRKRVRSVVESEMYLYLVHGLGDVCIVDNEQGTWDD